MRRHSRQQRCADSSAVWTEGMAPRGCCTRTLVCVEAPLLHLGQPNAAAIRLDFVCEQACELVGFFHVQSSTIFAISSTYELSDCDPSQTSVKHEPTRLFARHGRHVVASQHELQASVRSRSSSKLSVQIQCERWEGNAEPSARGTKLGCSRCWFRRSEGAVGKEASVEEAEGSEISHRQRQRRTCYRQE